MAAMLKQLSLEFIPEITVIRLIYIDRLNSSRIHIILTFLRSLILSFIHRIIFTINNFSKITDSLKVAAPNWIATASKFRNDKNQQYKQRENRLLSVS